MDILVHNGPSLTDLADKLSSRPPDFVAAHFNAALGTAGWAADAGVLHGATSCLGAMSHDGVTDGYAAFVIYDPDGAYGTAARPLGDSPRRASADAVKAALAQADRSGEVPELVWISATPGSEEDVLEGVQDVVGAQTPILGGSAADNDVSGQWFVFDGATKLTDGVIVSVLFPSRPISFAYHNGYAPTQNSGVVTKTDGRSLLEIDHRPAAEVFEDWTGGDVEQPASGAGPVAVLAESTMWPLGRKISSVGDVPFYLLAHPAVATPSGGLDLFATVEEGETITSMLGTRQGLIDRAGRVASLALATGNVDKDTISGALMIYCGGCMLAVRDDLEDVVSGVNDALGGAPFLGAFTFGEQGALLGAGNRHGNLMISCVVFG